MRAWSWFLLLVVAKKKKKDKITPDDELIHCDVCKLAVDYITSEAKEDTDFAEVCNPDDKLGLWIRKLDLVAKDRPGTFYEPQQLFLEGHGNQQPCNPECRSIQRACRDLTRGYEMEDMHRDGKLSQLCVKPCSKPAPAVPKGRKDYPYEPMVEETLDADNVKRMYRDLGMPFQALRGDEMKAQLDEQIKQGIIKMPKSPLKPKHFGPEEDIEGMNKDYTDQQAAAQKKREADL